jgi:hypothetical protein
VIGTARKTANFEPHAKPPIFLACGFYLRFLNRKFSACGFGLRFQNRKFAGVQFSKPQIFRHAVFKTAETANFSKDPKNTRKSHFFLPFH